MSNYEYNPLRASNIEINPDTVTGSYDLNNESTILGGTGTITDALNSVDVDISSLKNKTFKITYYEIIDISGGTIGSLSSTPPTAIIQEGQFGSSGNSVLSTIDGSGNVTGESPRDVSENVITANLDVNGNWVSSDNYNDPLAIIYSFVVDLEGVGGVDQSFALDWQVSSGTDVLAEGTSFEVDAIEIRNHLDDTSNPHGTSIENLTTSENDTTLYVRPDGSGGVQYATLPDNGVQSVTGDGVDNTDPVNPILSFPNPVEIGLGNVDNTSDVNKPISNLTQVALDNKSDLNHTHTKSDITDFNESDYATSSQGLNADSAVQAGDNISTLNNDSGYLTTEVDPVFTASPSFGILLTDINNWDTAFGWGDHSAAGYLTSIPGAFLQTGDNVSELINDVGYITSFTETDPIFNASEASNFTTGDKANLDNQSGVNTGDQIASTVPFTPAGNTISNNVQDAIEEIQTEVDNLSMDHGALSGLGDDDHPQYHNDVRGDARYSQLGHTHTASDITDFDNEVSNNPDVLLNTDKNSYPTADSVKLATIETGATSDQVADEVNIDPITGLTSTEVQGALEELASNTGGGTWGSITGTLSDQTDLQSELDDKMDLQPSAIAGNIGVFDSNGQIIDSGEALTPFIGYSRVYQWAEENGGLEANQVEYSYGNGATGTTTQPIGLTISDNGTIIDKVGFQSQTPGAANSITNIFVRTAAQGNGAGTLQGSIILPSGATQGIATLTTAITVEEGDMVYFQTSVNGGHIDVRPQIFQLVPIEMSGIIGPAGNDGINGMDGAPGVPNQIGVWRALGQNNVNTGAEQPVMISPTQDGENTFTTLGANVTLNGALDGFTLGEGVYEIFFTPNFNSTVVRANVRTRLYFDATLSKEFNGGNYNRAGSGHNETSDTVIKAYLVPSGQTRTLQIRQLQNSSGGTVNLQSDSEITIKRIAP